MYQTLKKVFSAFVSLTTIAWSVGLGTLALPSVASAASIASGDLIKASGPAVYYYGADGKRYVFPNEKTYFTWYPDFSTVKTITDSELAAIQIGGNVTYKPGVKMVKITTDPKVYAVAANGTLRWVMSEACAITLYGSNWNHMIDDVSDAFFVNYQTGPAIDCSASTFDPAAATAAATSINVDKGLSGSGVVTGGSVSVAIASDTPAGMNVPRNGSSIPMVKVNFTAGSAAVNITGLTFHRVGIGSASDFANVYLYDGSGLRLSTGRTVNSQSNLVSFNGLNINIAAGATWSAQLYADFAVAAGSTGGQHSFEVSDAASVVINGGTVSGAFPVRGNVFTVGTASSARVDVQKGSQPSNPTIGAQDTEISNFKITANTNDVSVKQVTLYQAGSVTNSDLTMFKLYQGSTVVATADSVGTDGHIVLKFNPAYLIPNGTTKVFSLHANVGGRAGRTIRTYVEYTTDVTAIDTVYNAGASICINTSGACAGSPANLDGTGGSGVAPITNGNFIEVLTQGGQLTNAFNGPATQNIAKGQLAVPLYKFTLTSPDNTLEVRKVVFTIAKTAGSAGTCNVVGTAGTNYFRSIKIKNMDTGVTWMGPIDFAAGVGTSKTITFTDTQNINAGQSLNLALVADLSNSEDAGDTFLDGACAYQASFTAFGSSDIRVVSTGEFLDTSKIVPNTNVTGNALTVKSSGLTASLASNPVSGTIVKKQQNVAVAGLVLTAAAQSDITITNLTLTGQAALAASGCAFGAGSCAAANFAQRVTSLALFDGATQVGQAKAPDTVTGKAQIANMNLVIPKGTSKNLTVMASFSSTASTTAPFDKIAVGVATANDIQAQDQDANTVVPTLDAAVTSQSSGAAPAVVQTILNSGTITVQADAHPVSNIVVAGKDAWVPFAQYKATAQYENVTIDRIAVLASSTLGTVSDNADFAVVAIASGGAVKGQDTISSGATGTKDIDLSTNTINVPKDGSVQFQIWAKVSAVQASSTVSGATTGVSRSGHAPALGLQSGLTTGEWDANYTGMLNIRSTGAASGERIYAATGAAHGNTQVLRKTVPIVTKQSLSSTTLANVDQDLVKFQVAADSAGSIAMKQVVFQFSKTAGVGLTNFRMRRGATDLDINTYAVTDDTGVDLKANPTAADTGYIVFAMKEGQEESISGSGNVYTLHATVSGASSGKSVTISFFRDATNPIVTGYLSNSNAFGVLPSSADVYNIDTGTVPDATADSQGTFLWSDNSEVPHSSANQTSRDWTNDVFVQDLSQQQTLSL